MDPLTIEGVYEDGRIKLDEQPAGVRKSRVAVTFLPETQEGEAGREAARQRAFARMERGILFGGAMFDREAIYGERIRNLDERRTARP